MSVVMALTVVASVGALPAAADPLPRAEPAAGSVIARKAGEEVRFVDLSNWQTVDLNQNLLGGDVLRTNATGQLAILFADRTQVRLGRNSALQVKQMARQGDTILNLQSGTMWARAQRGGSGLTVQTPAAAAAIRGTDWTLTVKGNQTSLIVLEGRVSLTNEQGSVEVGQGEAAVATIGQAPRKLVIVTPDDREQMLFYLTLRSGFTFMPASPLPVQKMRSERSRIEARPPEARSAEEWLTLAEVQISLDGRQKALESLAKARALKLSPAQRARADLIEALIAGAEKRYDEAATLFSRAERSLDPQRRSIAAYGGYYSRSLRDPAHNEKPPANVTGPYAAVMKAYTAGFLEDIPAAIATMKQAEARYPGDSTLPALRAQLAQLINDRVQMKEAIDRSLAIDPDDPNALQARARMLADYEGNLDDALLDLNAALKVAPGSSMVWNDLGLLQDARGASREAEAALKRSIELDPDDPIGHANLAILYLDQSRMKEAKREIDLALAADPSFDIALLARGRYYLQLGETDKAIDDLLAASTANPGHSQSQLMLAAGHYENGDRVLSEQAVDNADRLDKNDPVISAFRTAVAIDDYDADGAISNAQEFLRRSKARGGHYGSLGANQDAGSTLNNAFRLQGLDAWGRYYGDAVFDPFQGSGFVDQSIKGSIDPYSNAISFGDQITDYQASVSSFSSLFQGLLLDPHMLSGRSRSATLLRTPFVEGSLGAGLTNVDGHTRRLGEAEIQGFSNATIPISFYGNLTWEETPGEADFTGTGAFGGFSTENNVLGGNAYLTATITPEDRIVAYYNHSRQSFDLDGLQAADAFGIGILVPFYSDREDTVKATTAGLGWSHTFGYRNVLNAAVLYSGAKAESDRSYSVDIGFPVVPVVIPFGNGYQKSEVDSHVAAVSHSIGDDDLTWRYGIEAGWMKASSETFAQSLVLAPTFTDVEDSIDLGRVYVDLLHQVTPTLKLEYALFGTYMNGDAVDVSRLEPRVGVAWSPLEKHWLRAAYLRQGTDSATPTLSPVDVVGLQPNQISIGTEGYNDTIALQWDAEWSDRFFTSVGYQHQEMHDFSIALPLTGLAAIDAQQYARGSLDRAAVTANLALEHGFGLTATYAYMTSKNKDPAPGFADDLPYVPRHSGQVALTWVNEANVKATVAANYVGERSGDQLGTQLDSYWTLDANMIWEPLDKRFALEAAAFNLLDDDFEVAPGVPGWGRAVKGTLKVRF